jgi:hypothetical protein
MESDFARILGIILIALMIGFFYRNALKSIFETPKESFILAVPVIFLGILFYFFFKAKGF